MLTKATIYIDVSRAVTSKIGVRRHMARETYAKASSSRSYIPSQLNPIRRETNLVGDGR